MRANLLLLGVLTLLVFSCSKDDKPKPKDGKGDGLVGYSLGQNYSIVDENQQPISGAQILIGNAINAATQDNFFQADNRGQFAIPVFWTTPQNLTIDAKGFVRVTFMNEKPAARTLVLKKIKPAPTYEVKGSTSGHPIADRDGYVDFSLVMGAMSRHDLLNLDINKIISPVDDDITIVGKKISIPSNVSLPRQTENYIIGVTLEKPTYRLYFSEVGPQRIYAARGRFPFKTVVDQLRNNVPFYELVNYFSITGGSVKDISVSGGSTPLDIPVNDLNFTEKLNVQAPEFASDNVMLSASVANMGGNLIPTDVKRFNSRDKLALSVLTGHPALIAHVLKKKSELVSTSVNVDRLSGVLVPFNNNNEVQFLSMIDNPTNTSEYGYHFQIPQKPNAVHSIATYAMISDKDANQVVHRWEVYSPTWSSDLELPHWPLNDKFGTQRIEVSFVGSLNSGAVEMGPQIIEAATHVTRSSVDY